MPMTCQNVKMPQPTAHLSTVTEISQFLTFPPIQDSSPSDFFSLSRKQLEDSFQKMSPLCQFSRALKVKEDSFCPPGRGSVMSFRCIVGWATQFTCVAEHLVLRSFCEGGREQAGSHLTCFPAACILAENVASRSSSSPVFEVGICDVGWCLRPPTTFAKMGTAAYHGSSCRYRESWICRCPLFRYLRFLSLFKPDSLKAFSLKAFSERRTS